MGTYELIISNKDNQEFHFMAETTDDGIRLLRYETSDISDISLPEQIEGNTIGEIADGCFFNHREIKRITLPNQLKTIGTQAFGMCKGISEIIIPDSVSEIKSMAFRDCTGLKKIVLPKSLKCLRSGVFAFCNLPDDAEVILNNGLETIESRVFYSSLNLFFELNLPDSVKTIDSEAFEPGMKIKTNLPINEEWFSN